MGEVRCVAACADRLGEGPSWSQDEGRLYWFDIKGRKLHWLEPATGRKGEWPLPLTATAAAPRAAGGLILATEGGLARFDTHTGELEIFQPLVLEHGFRTNDGKMDPQGRFWWSTMDDNGGERPGCLYRTDPPRRTRKIMEGIHIPNTVSVTADGRTLYLADSGKGVLFAHSLDEDGALGERRTFADLSGEGIAPDGGALDAEGYLWNAQWGGWRVVRYAPDGRVDRVVQTPVEQPTSCCFGGPDLATLYVTSAHDGLDAHARAKQPLAGALLAFEPGVRGLPLPSFEG